MGKLFVISKYYYYFKIKVMLDALPKFI